jgi:hypothetical protein
MGKLKQLILSALSNRKVTLLILIIVIVSRILQLLYLFNTRNDMSFQIQAAQALYEGHGVSSAKIVADDLSTIYYQPLMQWPPGFSILFLPFYALLGQDYLSAALLLNILSAVVLLFFNRGILKLLDVPVIGINLFTIVTGFSLYYFYLKPCTDSTAIALFVMAIYYTLSLIKSNRHVSKKTITIAFTLLLCGFIKYLYLPVVFLIPVIILAKGFFGEKPYLKKAGGALLSVLFIAFLSFFIWQKVSSGTVGYIREPERGFYPGNLLAAHPYIPASFIKPETLEWFTHCSPQTAAIILKIFQGIHLILFLWLAVYGVKQASKQRWKVTTVTGSFFYVTLLVSFIITGLLTWLSIRVAKEYVDEGIFWTYVEEPRYYGAVQVFLHLASFLILRFVYLNRMLKYLFYFLFVCMFFEMLRGMVFTAHRIFNFAKEEYGWQRELKLQRLASAMVTEEKTKQNADKIVLIGTSDWTTLRAGLYCRLPIFTEVEKLNNLSAVNTKKPVLLFAIIKKDHVPYFGTFVNSNKTKYVGSGEGFLFYTQMIMPGNPNTF